MRAMNTACVRLGVTRFQQGSFDPAARWRKAEKDMKEMFSMKSVTALFSAAAITATMLGGFYQATSSVPTQWPISFNGAAQPVQKLS
jgi:hypothetical protein